jgi:hypothetical protein
MGHIVYTNPQKPTCTVTGAGAGASCAVDNYSTDSDGVLIITTAGAPSATGTIALTFARSMGTNGAECLFTPNQGGASLWSAASAPAFFYSTLARGSAIQNAYWSNFGTNLTTATTYDVNYHCIGAQ